MPPYFGHPQGIQLGEHFATRLELSLAGVHRPRIAGIAGTQTLGCDSIVVTEGYEDDRDDYDWIHYTGSGGRDPKTHRQVLDQELTRHNLALVVSMQQQLPVRVSRGPKLGSPYAPASGYRYDGLWLVDSYEQDVGLRGFRIYRFHLLRMQGESLPADRVGTR